MNPADFAPDGPGDLPQSDVTAPDLAALAAELEAALVDQRDHGASAHEVAGRVRAVARVLRGEGTR